MDGPQPDHDNAIQRFLRWEKSSARSGTHGFNNDVQQQYISHNSLDKYFKSVPVVREILRELFPTETLDADYVWQHYRRGFAILLSINEGRMIRQFMESLSLQDTQLPFDVEPPKDFPAASERDLFSSFYRRQWRYLPQKLQYKMRGRISDDVILPFERKEKLGRGGSANVYKISVDEEYNHLHRAADHVHRKRFFALKTYHGRHAEKHFEKEKEAFGRLNHGSKPPASIIGFHGSFIRHETFNLILEYAEEGTLANFMKSHPPPSSGEDIILLWDNLVSLLLGLQNLHQIDDNGMSCSILMSGWHQDVKPNNILVKSRQGAKSHYDVEFMIADLGQSHFKWSSSSSERELTDRDTYGTKAYGAPEAHRIDRAAGDVQVNVSKRVDIWSLGCIYSEVATWIGHGLPRVEQYQAQRRSEAVSKLNNADVGDLFHDGEKVLDAVGESHSLIHDSRRVDDFITSRILNDLIGEMLETERERLDAFQAYKKAQKALQAARTELDRHKHGNSSSSPQPINNRLYSPPAESSQPGPLPSQEVPTANGTSSPSPSPSPSPSASAGERGKSPRPPITGATQNGEPNEESPPQLSVAKAIVWRNNRKFGRDAILPDKHHLADIKGRDSIFLVDNSASMQAHKSEVRKVLEAMAYLVKRYDPDGVDMIFTQSDRTVKATTKTTALLDQLGRVDFTGRTDMQLKLGNILDTYKARVTRQQATSGWRHSLFRSQPQGPPRKLSLYILTDGYWQPGCDVESVIRSMVDCLVTHDLHNKQVAIQFIQFGSGSPQIVEQLRRLDDGLGLQLDIVDTTPSIGNVWKMILGAIHTWFDRDNRPMTP